MGLLLPFLVEYSYKGDVNLAHLMCLKDAIGSAHGRGACPLPSRFFYLLEGNGYIVLHAVCPACRSVAAKVRNFSGFETSCPVKLKTCGF